MKKIFIQLIFLIAMVCCCQWSVAQTSSLHFDGTNDHVLFGNLVVPTAGNFTVEFWINSTSVSGFREFISQGASGDAFYIGTTDGSALMRCGDKWQSPGVSLPLNQWVHVALVKSGTNGLLYLNGSLVATVSNYSISASGTNTTLGKQYGGIDEFPLATMDELRIWDIARTPCEIKNNLNVSLTGSEPGLIGYYNFNNPLVTPGGTNTGITNLDDLATGNGAQNGTLTNFALTGSTSNWVNEYTGVSLTWYQDNDGDLYGSSVTTTALIPTAGYVCATGDCNDGNIAVNPGATELCNGLDDNCDGITDSTFISGLKLYLPFNGNANDISNNNHNGTLINSPTLTTGHKGITNSAYQFNGSNRIDVANHADLEPTSLTLSCWVYYTSVPGGIQVIVSKGYCSGYGDSYTMWFMNGQFHVALAYAPNSYSQFTFTAPVANQWHHLVMSFDNPSDVVKVYIDNVLSGTFSFTSNLYYENYPLIVGADWDLCGYNYYYNSKADEVMLFDRALSASEVNRLYLSGPYENLGTEICNGVDDDCDGLIDEGLTSTYYADADGDGYGNPAAPQIACTQPIGYVTNNLDCNDGNANTNPRAIDSYDGIDNDCDGIADQNSIVRYQYFFDTEPGVGLVGNGAFINVSPTSDSANITTSISTSGLAEGFHTLYVRAQSVKGSWGLWRSYPFSITTPPTVTNHTITNAEYYFDTETGISSAVQLPIGVSPSDSVNFISSIPTTGLSEGFHTLYLRVKDSENHWGLWRSYPFTITPPPTITNHTVTHAEYYFDTETGVASAVQLPIGVSPSDSVNFISSIPSTGLNEGFHTLYLRVKDSQNHWGLWRSYPFAVTPPPPPVSQIIDGEAFFDTDPGVGNGIPLWLPTASLDSVNISRNVFAPNSLGNGTHHAYFRWRDSNGKWGLYDRASFTVSGSACILPASITANGPITICTGGQVILTENSMGAFTWQWKESGNNVGTNSRHLTVNSSGTYTCEVTSGSCTATSNTIVVVVYPPQTWYEDFDSDGFGNPSVTLLACLQPSGYVSNNTDCNDNNVNIHAPFQYFIDADHDGYGSTTTAMVCALTPPLGYSSNDDDCDDTKNFVHPGATEICGNGIDDDCNGTIDGNQFTLSAIPQHVQCKGLNTGSIDVSESEAGIYTFLWNNGKTTEDNSNLFAGVYTVTATNQPGCSATLSVTITQPATVLTSSVAKTNIRCGGKSTGVATISASGGVAPYTYLWSNGLGTAATVSNLSALTYTVTVTDAAGCSKSKTLTISQNPTMILIANATSATTATVTSLTGGVPPYAYYWNSVPVQTTVNASGLSPGSTYKVKVTDSKGCTKVATVVTPNSKTANIESGSIAVIPNPSDGNIMLQMNGNASGNHRIRIYNSEGRLVDERLLHFESGKATLNLTQLSSGLYYLQMDEGNTTTGIKFLIE